MHDADPAECVPPPAGHYTLDTAFPSAFCHRQTPAHLSVVAGLAGIDCAPPDADFQAIDIGCGSGMTLAMAASIHPRADFIGIDFNPSHIEAARELAERMALDNVRFIQADVADIDAWVLPKADYVSCIGLFSWLDDTRQAALLRSVAGLMSSRGLFVLDYAARPGSLAAEGLYEWLRQLAQSKQGSSVERLGAAINEAKALMQAGPAFAEAYPAAPSRLESLACGDAAAEAHEVFNLTRGIWFHDLTTRMRAEGLEYTGSAALRGVDGMSMASELRRDMICNTGYRMDVYARQTPTCKPTQALLERPVARGAGNAPAVAGREQVECARNVAAHPDACVGHVLDALNGDVRALADALAADQVRVGLAAPVSVPKVTPQWRAASPAVEAQLLAGLTDPAGGLLLSPVTGEAVDPPVGDRFAILVLCGTDPLLVRRHIRSAGPAGPWPDLDAESFAAKARRHAQASEALARALAGLGLLRAD